MLAERTSRDEARASHIQMCLRKAFLCSAIGALPLRAGNVYCEYSTQFTCGSIAIDVAHRRIHFRSPVAPKRSVLIISRSEPAAIKSSVTYSTNDVGPQT